MITVETNVLVEFKDFVGDAFTAFMPLFATVVGIFIAFAVANSARFLIQRMIKK
jgi:hypothetical protein